MADEDPDDPQLKALRAVWLSMRDSDEDPPDSGVSALMAAARSQASMMAVAQAPWWKRMFDQLRRPPVLALATLLVLIGGAVVLTNHHEALEKAPTSAPAQEKELPRANLEIGGAPPAATTTDKADHQVQHKSLDKAKDNAPASATSSATSPATSQATPPATPPATSQTPPGPVRRPPASHTSGGKGMAAPGGQPAPSAPSTDAPAFESGTASAAKGDTTPTPAPANAAKTKATPAPEPAPAPSRVLVDQLAAQARKAARRGDCENAKAIATRIAGQDATYYRDHVAGDLASCVPAPAAADAAAH